jgi:hypothetical protein
VAVAQRSPLFLGSLVGVVALPLIAIIANSLWCYSAWEPWFSKLWG